MEIINIDKDNIKKIINKIFKDSLPRNSSLINILSKLFNNYNISNSIFKVYGIKYFNGNKIKGDNLDHIIEEISYIDSFCPLIEFYNHNGYKYEKCNENLDIDDKYLKQENLIEFYLSIDDSFILEKKDLEFYKYIKGIINNDKYYKKLLYVLLKYDNIDPEYIIDIIKIPNIKLNINM